MSGPYGQSTGQGFIHEPAPHLLSSTTSTHAQSHVQMSPHTQYDYSAQGYPLSPQAPSYQHLPPLPSGPASHAHSPIPLHTPSHPIPPPPPQDATPHTLVQQAFPPSAPFLAPSTMHAAPPPAPALASEAMGALGAGRGAAGGGGAGGGGGGMKSSLLGILNAKHPAGASLGSSPGLGVYGSGPVYGLEGGAGGSIQGGAGAGYTGYRTGPNVGYMAEHAGERVQGSGYTQMATSAGLPHAPPHTSIIAYNPTSQVTASQSASATIPPQPQSIPPIPPPASSAPLAPLEPLDLDLSLDLDAEVEADSIFRDMTFDEVLEELNARFLVNLPREEMGLVRVYWQAEQAHWFYEDYLRPLNPHLPSLSQRHFSQLIIASSPIYPILAGTASTSTSTSTGAGSGTGNALGTREVAGHVDAIDPAIVSLAPPAGTAGQAANGGEVNMAKGGRGRGGKGKGKKQQQQQQQQIQEPGIDYDAVWAEYVAYKSMVPCCGGIILNEAGDKALMVRGYKSSAGWCFPRGKININEPELTCAIREVYEETGFDLTNYIKDGERDRIQTQINAQTVTMFIAMGVREGTRFEARTKKEIGAIEWVSLADLPTWSGRKPKRNNASHVAGGGVGEGKAKRYYNVTPFVGPLKRWLVEHGVPINPKSNSRKNANTAQTAYASSGQGTGKHGVGFGTSGMGSYASSDMYGADAAGARALQPFFGAEQTAARSGTGGSLQADPPGTVGMMRPTQATSRIHGQGQHTQQPSHATHAEKATALDQLFGQFASLSASTHSSAPIRSHDAVEVRDFPGLSFEGGAEGSVPGGLDKLFGALGGGHNPSIDTQGSSGQEAVSGAHGQREEWANGGDEHDEALAALLGSPLPTPKPALDMASPVEKASKGGEGKEKQRRLLALLGAGAAGAAGKGLGRDQGDGTGIDARAGMRMGIGTGPQGVGEGQAGGLSEVGMQDTTRADISPQMPNGVGAGVIQRDGRQSMNAAAGTYDDHPSTSVASPYATSAPAQSQMHPSSPDAVPNAAAGSIPVTLRHASSSANKGTSAGMSDRQSNLLSLLSPPAQTRTLSSSYGGDMRTDTTPNNGLPGGDTVQVGRGVGAASRGGLKADAGTDVHGEGAEEQKQKQKKRQADLLASLAGLGGGYGGGSAGMIEGVGTAGAGVVEQPLAGDVYSGEGMGGYAPLEAVFDGFGRTQAGGDQQNQYQHQQRQQQQQQHQRYPDISGMTHVQLGTGGSAAPAQQEPPSGRGQLYGYAQGGGDPQHRLLAALQGSTAADGGHGSNGAFAVGAAVPQHMWAGRQQDPSALGQGQYQYADRHSQPHSQPQPQPLPYPHSNGPQPHHQYQQFNGYGDASDLATAPGPAPASTLAATSTLPSPPSAAHHSQWQNGYTAPHQSSSTSNSNSNGVVATGRSQEAHANVLHPVPKAGASMGLLAMLNGK